MLLSSGVLQLLLVLRQLCVVLRRGVLSSLPQGCVLCACAGVVVCMVL